MIFDIFLYEIFLKCLRYILYICMCFILIYEIKIYNISLVCFDILNNNTVCKNHNIY